MTTSTSSVPAAPPLEERVSCLEKVANEMEKSLAALETAVGKNGAAEGKTSGPTPPSQNNNTELVQKLRTLFDLLQQDRAECEAIRAQRDDLSDENARLRTQVKKHEYRIKHLLRTIGELEQKK